MHSNHLMKSSMNSVDKKNADNWGRKIYFLRASAGGSDLGDGDLRCVGCNHAMRRDNFLKRLGECSVPNIHQREPKLFVSTERTFCLIVKSSKTASMTKSAFDMSFSLSGFCKGIT